MRAQLADRRSADGADPSFDHWMARTLPIWAAARYGRTLVTMRADQVRLYPDICRCPVTVVRTVPIFAERWYRRFPYSVIGGLLARAIVHLDHDPSPVVTLKSHFIVSQHA
jgi:hypothetical protein